MGHYDECRPGYCAACGATGNARNETCDFCDKKKSPTPPPPGHQRLGRAEMIQDKVLDVLTGRGTLKRVRKGGAQVDVYIDRKGGSFTVQVNGRVVKIKNIGSSTKLENAVADEVAEVTKALASKGKSFNVYQYDI